MIYFLFFVVGFILGSLFIFFVRKRAKYPGELVVANNPGGKDTLYLVMDEDFSKNIRFADSVILKVVHSKR